jgi:Tfp pilus assembly protein PilF
MDMKTANLVLAAALAAAGVTSATAVLLTPATAIAATAQPKVSAKMLKPLKAAQEAVQAKNWEAALAALTEAQAVEPKSEYDAYMVDELSWYPKLQVKDYAGAAQSLERAVASGFVAEADLGPRYKALAQLNYQTKEYAKAVEFGSKALALSPDSQDVAALVAQSKFLQQDYAGARAVVDQTASRVAKPDEQLLMIGLRSSYELNDRVATRSAIESLVRYYPAPKYWEDLLNNQLYETKTDRDLRALYRLIFDTNTMNKAEEYSEAAAMLMTGGFPAEARRVLEQGLAASVFTGESLTRAQAELQRARSGADADAKDLPGADTALAAAKSGNEMVAIGKLYFSAGQYDKAADAIRKGLAKGGVTDVDDANVLLGIAEVRGGNGQASAPAFDAINDAKLKEVASLWKLYVATTSAAAAPATDSATAAPSAQPEG